LLEDEEVCVDVSWRLMLEFVVLKVEDADKMAASRHFLA
jgi:hypothetical protein